MADPSDRFYAADFSSRIAADRQPRPRSNGKSGAKALEQAQRGVFELWLSKAIIEELRSRLLYRRKIRKSYQYTDERVEQHCRDLEAVARVVSALPRVRVVERDPNDDMVIACALAAQADYIVTRDKDLLALGAHAGVRIVTPRQLLDLP